MTRQTRHLVIFARAPKLGAVKKRLARDIGPIAAWQFYRRNLWALTARLGADRRWRTCLAVTGGKACWPAGVPLVEQGGGDLGARMARIMRTMPKGPVVIVGSDIPDIGAAHIASAFAALGTHDVAIGAATDGGYWLIGQARRRPLPKLFENVRWSSKHAMADTLANLDARHRIAVLEELSDVDDGEDYRRWRRAGGAVSN